MGTPHFREWSVFAPTIDLVGNVPHMQIKCNKWERRNKEEKE